MFILDADGDLVNLASVNQIYYHEIANEILAIIQPKGENSLPLFKGTADECRSYLARLIHALSTQGQLLRLPPARSFPPTAVSPPPFPGRQS